MYRTYFAEKSSAKVIPIQKSICEMTGLEIITLVCEYPRAIHSQLLTHRVFSKNSSSTRAVPIKTAIAQIMENPAKQIWTYNEPGMQGKEIVDFAEIVEIEAAVKAHQNSAFELALYLNSKKSEGGLNVHKQNAGRYLEPFQNIRICLTSTEWENWDWLRLDEDAQPEIKELAELMKQARDEMTGFFLHYEEYHLPFINRKRHVQTGKISYHHPESDVTLDLSRAIDLSMSICAQTSYRKEDYSDEKTDSVTSRLFKGRKVHASPSEHQATPIGHVSSTNPLYWPAGVTHMDVDGNYWSGNFRGWIQQRQLIPNHDYAKKV